MTNEIKKNLEKLFRTNYAKVKDSSIYVLFDQLIINNPEGYDLDLEITRKIFDSKDLELFEKTKQNPTLISHFNRALKIHDNDEVTIQSFMNDIVTSMDQIKEKVIQDNAGYENQIIFLEHDYPRIASFCGWGKQDNIPILKKPEYINYSYEEEIFNGIGGIDYTKFWKDVICIEEILEDLELIDLVVGFSDIYLFLIEAYWYKTYLLLHESFDRLGTELFNDLPIKKPMYIFANEHDCPAMNIYIYE